MSVPIALSQGMHESTTVILSTTVLHPRARSVLFKTPIYMRKMFTDYSLYFTPTGLFKPIRDGVVQPNLFYR